MPLICVTIFPNWHLKLEERGNPPDFAKSIKPNFASILGSVTFRLDNRMLKVNYVTHFSVGHYMVWLVYFMVVESTSYGKICAFWCSCVDILGSQLLIQIEMMFSISPLPFVLVLWKILDILCLLSYFHMTVSTYVWICEWNSAPYWQ